ncbi:MAG: ATP:cob(I)alamin adenosyltransferase [Bacteriovoracaceae bacterium]|nr:ATP:cob(I)alamin adenosyltransferase [Bacteriovoracaceae bacterium]
MKIYTCRGDNGQTDLNGQGRVAKNDPRIVAVGELDELKAVWDLAVLHLALGPCPLDIRHALEIIAGYVVTPEDKWPQLGPFTEDCVKQLELAIDTWDALLLPLKSWLPAPTNLGPAYLQVARCVCRRAERALVEVKLPAAQKQFINRLADFLFTAGRYFEQYGRKNGWKISGP